MENKRNFRAIFGARLLPRLEQVPEPVMLDEDLLRPEQEGALDRGRGPAFVAKIAAAPAPADPTPPAGRRRVYVPSA